MHSHRVGRFTQADVAAAEVHLWARSGEGSLGAISLKYFPTPCRFGGGRFWFVCAGSSRPVYKLYAPPPFDVYACRTWHDPTYGS